MDLFLIVLYLISSLYVINGFASIYKMKNIFFVTRKNQKDYFKFILSGCILVSWIIFNIYGIELSDYIFIIFLIFVLFNVCFFTLLFLISKEIKEIKLRSKRKIDLTKFNEELHKFSEIPSGRGFRCFIKSGLFIIESEDGFREKEELFVSELNYILPKKYYCDDPNKAQTIILLKINYKQNHRYSWTDEYFYEYSAKIINKNLYLGEIIYREQEKPLNKIALNDFFGIKINYSDMKDILYLKFLLNTDFSNLTTIDSFSSHVKAVKSIWNNGKLRYKGYYDVVNKVKEGLWKEYYKNGILKSERYFKDGQLYGLSKYYYENGILEEEGNFGHAGIDSSRKIGKWKYFYQNGKIKCEGDYATNEEWKYYYISGALKYVWKFMGKGYNHLGELNYAYFRYYNEDGSLKSEDNEFIDYELNFNIGIEEIKYILNPYSKIEYD